MQPVLDGFRKAPAMGKYSDCNVGMERCFKSIYSFTLEVSKWGQ